MSFIQLPGLNDVRPPEVHPEGRVGLVILDAKPKEKEGKMGINCLMGIDEPHPEPGREWSNFFHYISLPTKDDDAEKVKTKLRMIKQFCVQFGVPTDDGFDPAQVIGSRGEGNIVVEDYQDQPQNKLKLDPLPRG